MNSRRKCGGCKEYFPVGNMTKMFPSQTMYVCSDACKERVRLARGAKPRPPSIEDLPFSLVNGERVYRDDDRLFVWKQQRRMYGHVLECEACTRKFFRDDRNFRGRSFCSRRCSKLRQHNPRSSPQGSSTTTEYLDKLFSRLIRASAGNTCVNCGSHSYPECAHGFSRRYKSVRWDTDNAFCLCRRCHAHYTGSPIEWEDWLRARWATQGIDYDQKRREALNGPPPEKADVLDHLKASLTALGESWT